MERFFRSVVRHKGIVLTVFAAVTVLCALLARQVQVNYDFVDYLPASSPSTIALDVMAEEFDGGVPNARLMVPDILVPEALALKEKLQEVDGIQAVTWLDDAADLHVPLAMLDEGLLRDYYRDGTALFTLTIDTARTIDATEQARRIAGDNCAMTGAAVNTAVVTKSTGEEISRSMLFIIPLCFVVLLLTTGSWFEPVLFMLTIGVAILLNNGTNLLFGSISFVTNAAGSILQLAVSMDYSIFLLHRFSDCRAEGMDVQEAMVTALKRALTSITASGITTVIGFAALILMRFKIGPDMGLVMAKAIVLSMISVLVFLPVMALLCYKLIDKTQHRPLMPRFEWFSRFVPKLRVPAVCIFLLLIAPSFLAQNSNDFYFGASQIIGNTTPAYAEREEIESVFGKSNQMVLMVPRGDFATEALLSQTLHDIPQVSSVLSYVDLAGAEVPPEYLDPSTLSQLLSEHYSRMVLTVQTDYEGNEAFAVVEQVRAAAETYYGDAYQLAGDSVNTYDMREVVTSDMLKVNLIAIGAVFLVLLLTMRSVLLPAILVLAIETSIWINLSVPYFSGETLHYISYLIISSVQLGATVDYAILFANRYLEERRVYHKREALQQTIQHTTLSILTSAAILTLGGSLLGAISTNGVISQLGFLVGRGAVLSAVLVLFVLPGLLALLDKAIQKATMGLKLKQKEDA